MLVNLPADPHEGLTLLLNHPSNLCRSDRTTTTDRTEQIAQIQTKRTKKKGKSHQTAKLLQIRKQTLRDDMTGQNTQKITFLFSSRRLKCDAEAHVI